MEEKLLDRALYKQIKKMDRNALEGTLQRIYQLGYDAALEDGAVEVDTNDLREELGKLKGIGENRLNEIMKVFEKYIGSISDL